MRITLSLFALAMLFTLTSWAGDLVEMPLPEIAAPSSEGFVQSFQGTAPAQMTAPTTIPTMAPSAPAAEEPTSTYENAFSSIRSKKNIDPNEEWQRDQGKPDSFDLDNMTDNNNYTPPANESQPAPTYQNSFAEEKRAPASKHMAAVSERAPSSVSEEEFVDVGQPPQKAAEPQHNSVPSHETATDESVNPVSAKERHALVMQTISENYDQLKRCYSDGLKKKPAMHGKVLMAWTMDKQGRVGEASVESSDLNNQVVEQCMTKSLASWHFPRSAKSGGSRDRMSYTFEFNQDKE